MNTRLPRILLVLAALLLIGGGVFHALAFGKALPIIGSAHLPDLYARFFKALWLCDSTTLIATGLFFALVAARPSIAGRWAIVLVALIPAATAVLVYAFVGNFLPGHILVTASLLAIVAAFRFPRTA